MRTDLAVELRECVGECEGVETESINFGAVEIDRTHIINNLGAEKLGKPIGNYITISFDGFAPEEMEGDIHSAIKSELGFLLGNNDLVLVACLGNRNITPDALGPMVAEKTLATRHINPATAEMLGLKNLRSVEVITPGVLGQTGMEAGELILAAVKETKPGAVIVIDALAARSAKRVGNTVQLSDSGICPGSGVGNSRKEISKKTLGVPVIALGVPTVVDADTFLQDEGHNPPQRDEKYMVTPRDIDSIIEYSAKVLAHAINSALQPHIPSKTLLELTL